MMMQAEPGRKVLLIRRIGLFAGPPLALLVFTLLPSTIVSTGGEQVALGDAARALAAVGVLMAVWWITEALPIEATALVPLALFPLLGVVSIKAAAAPYADPVIFLFMGGLILGLSMERWGLHRRIALLTIRLVGTRPTMLIGGIMLATAVMSMWVSNTATSVMMLPIGLSIARLVRERLPAERADRGAAFATCLMLGIAYAASIGGVGTLVGTPPNAVLKGIAGAERLDPPLTFSRWLWFGVPLVLVFLPLSWAIMTRVLYRIPREPIPGLRGEITGMARALGPMNRGEWITFIVFMCTALLWIFRSVLVDELGLRAGPPGREFDLLTDEGLAIIAALALFLIPVNLQRREFAMDWETAVKLPWGVLILFGGGLSLAAAMSATGLDQYIAAAIDVRGLHPLLVILLLTAAMVFLTEVASNTAVATTFLPLALVLAPTAGVHPYLLMVPLAIGSSYAFMMPMGTPPNALVFSSGHVNIRQMASTGILLNIAAILTITLFSYFAAPVLLGFEARP